MNIYNNFFLLFSTRIMITKVTYQRSQCPTTQTLSKNISIVYFTQTFYLKGLLHLLTKKATFLLQSCARLLDRIISRSIQHSVVSKRRFFISTKSVCSVIFFLQSILFPNLKVIGQTNIQLQHAFPSHFAFVPNLFRIFCSGRRRWMKQRCSAAHCHFHCQGASGMCVHNKPRGWGWRSTCGSITELLMIVTFLIIIMPPSKGETHLTRTSLM